MNSSNRSMNRFVLILAGLVLITVSATALVSSVATPIREQVSGFLGSVYATVFADWIFQLPWQEGTEYTVDGPVVMFIAALVIAVVVVTVGLSVLFSRGGGRSGKLLADKSISGTGSGTINIASGAAADLFLVGIPDRNDIVHSSTSVYSVKGQPTVKLRIQPRQGASLAAITAAISSAVSQADTLLGRQVPVVVELVEGARARFATNERAGASLPKPAVPQVKSSLTHSSQP